MEKKMPVEFKPSLWRLFLRPIPIAIVLGLGVSIIFPDPSATLQSQLLLVLIYMLVLWILIFFAVGPDSKLHRITISGQELSGPTVKRRRATLTISKIDLAKSYRQDWRDTLFNSHWFYSTEGETIIVRGDAYAKGAFDQMLKIIGDLQNESAAPAPEVE